MRFLERNSEVGEMELRDPYEVNYAGQRRQSAQSRNAQAYRPQRQGTQSRNVQVYNLQREGVQNRNAQAYHPQREGMQSRNAQAYRPQREEAQSRNVQAYHPQREGTQPRNVQVYNPQREDTQLRNAQVYRSQREGAQNRNVQVYRPQREGAQSRNAQVYRPQGSARNYGVQNRRAAAPRRRKRACRQMLVAAALTLAIACLGCMLLVKGYQALAAEPKPHEIPYRNSTGDKTSKSNENGLIQGISAVEFAKHPKMEENFLTLNDYSRPGEALTEVKNIFVHYTANPGTSAAQNRNYFEQQKDTHKNSVSAHFIIGYDGEIIQCVPLDEIAYAVAGRNYDSVSIECCYEAEDGSFSSETYDSLIGLLAWLTDIYDLDSEDILRHYDSNGKLCPIYYTEHSDEWAQLKKDVKTARGKTGK